MVFSSSRLRIHPVSFCALRGTTVASLPFRYSSIQKIKYLLFIYYAVKISTVIVLENGKVVVIHQLTGTRIR